MRGTTLSLLLGLATTLLPLPATAQPSAFEILAQTRRAYAALESYHDTGVIERVSRRDGQEVEARLEFETVAGPEGSFQWRLHLEAPEGQRRQVLWRESDKAQLYDSAIEQYKPVASLSAELVRGFGAVGLDALAVPALLSGSQDALADPEAASYAGQEPCPGLSETACHVLDLARMAGEIESRLWIDTQSYLIRRIELSHQPFTLSGTATLTSLTIEHRISSEDQPLSASRRTYNPPSAARRVENWEITKTADADDLLPDIAFQDEITVELFTVLARIVDSRGEPLKDLVPMDLEARVGKAVVPVVGVDWYASGQSLEAQAQAAGVPQAELQKLALPKTASGKLMVLFLQADFNAIRIHGHLRMLPFAKELIAGLHPQDRLAVVTFDSHLKLWQDFTRDHQKVQDILDQAMRFGGKPLARREGRISLHEHFDFAEAKKAATPEKALQITAEALAELPGDKEMIYLGWGLGRYGAGGVRMIGDYWPAVRTLGKARTTVFVLDVTDADSHSLEVGLQSVAASTGGTYEKTHVFTEQVVGRLARTLQGHFLLTLDRSQLGDQHGRLKIELRKGRKGRVIYRPVSL